MNRNNKIPSKSSSGVLSVFFVISIIFGLGFAGISHYLYHGAETVLPVALGFMAGFCFPLAFTIFVLWVISLSKAFGANSPDGMMH